MNDNFQIMDALEFEKRYTTLEPSYNSLGMEIQANIKIALKAAKISFLDVPMRIKDMSSAYEKVGLKRIDNPFEKIEDWCGLRVICYYEDDIDNVCQLLRDKFLVRKEYNVSERLGTKEFGYRSTHLILTLKDEHADYIQVKGRVAEVQVRTSLMHTWAEIEHKLQYKGKGSVPSKIQRIFSQLSSALEAVDRQFVELREQLSDYRVIIDRKKSIHEFKGEDLDIYILNAFLKIAFPDRYVDENFVARVLYHFLIEAGLSMSDVVNAYEFGKGYINRAGEVHAAPLRRNITGEEAGFIFANAQPIALMAALAMSSDKFYYLLCNKMGQPGQGNPPARWVAAIRDVRPSAQKIH